MKKYLCTLLAAMLAPAAHASCGSSFCTVDTNWDTQGLASADGLRLDARYSYAKANTLRAGHSRIAAATPSGSDEEIENQRTINRLLNLDAEYTFNTRWSATLSVPVVMRDHRHTFDSSLDGPFTQSASFHEIGDMRVVGKYRLDPHNPFSGFGLRFGLKLPTGATNKTMNPPDPADPGTPYALERSAQPGSGSTDAILGAYYFQTLPGTGWGWFASAQLQTALATRSDYRPGTEVKLDLGTHYELAPGLTGLLQLNALHRPRDGGAAANPASGGHAFYLSPGLSYAVAPHTQIYGLLQLAVSQYAKTDPLDPQAGQLTSPRSFTVGLSQRF